MNKGILYLAITIGGAIGAYLPVILFHADGLSLISIAGGTIASIAAIFIVYKMDL